MAEVTSYRRNIAGEHYVLRSRFGPVGMDIERRTRAVRDMAYRTAPLGEVRVGDPWAPSRIPGALKRSHRYTVEMEGGQVVGTVIADPIPDRGRTTSYAASVHEGSDPHLIFPRDRSKRLRWPNPDGSQNFRGRGQAVAHPGTRRGRPWLRDSLAAAAD